MKPQLLIIGAGNIGGFISYNVKMFGDYEVLGFLDDDPLKIGTEIYGRKVLGNTAAIDHYIKEDTIAVVIGIGNPGVKSNIAAMLARKNVSFPNFIAPNVWMSKNVTLGRGIIMYPGVSINYETTVNDFVILNMNCAIGHNCVFGEFSTLAPGVNLAGFTNIGAKADVGIGVTSIQGVQIGENARVGAQTVLLRDVPAGAVSVGNPGRIIRNSNK